MTIRCTTTATATLTVDIADHGGRSTSDPAGIDCGHTCTAEFPYGTTVTLTATPGGTNRFAAWSGACEGAGATCTLVLTGDRTTTARFALTVPSSCAEIEQISPSSASGLYLLDPDGIGPLLGLPASCDSMPLREVMVTFPSTGGAG